MGKLKNYVRRAALVCGAVLFAVFVTAPSVFAAITVNDYPITTTNTQPHELTLGSDGNLWYVGWQSDDVQVMSPDGSFVARYPLPTRVPANQPNSIATGPDGNVWFVEYSSNYIGRMDTSGNLDEWPIPTPNSLPHSIAPGPDGNMWFTEFNANKIGMITVDGEITEYTIPTPNSQPFGITVGPNNTMWFSESHPAANKLGVVSGLTIPTPPTPGTPDHDGNGSGSGEASPKAPHTGFGVFRYNPLQTLLAYSLGAGLLLGVALALRKLANAAPYRDRSRW